jgi:hypothetical protein
VATPRYLAMRAAAREKVLGGYTEQITAAAFAQIVAGALNHA